MLASGAPDTAMLTEIEARDNIFDEVSHRVYATRTRR
jgi:predicted glycosyl hydrolase (DUF1957 family)